MTYVVAATGNAHKIEELIPLFGEFGVEVVSKTQAGVSAPDPEETGATFEENSLIKARSVFEICGKSTVADDSGLQVDALDGEPGIFSARFSEKYGVDLSSISIDAANNELLLELLKNVPENKRTARFVCAIALLTEDSEPIVVRGVCEGRIANAPAGEEGFGYDPIFIPNEYALSERTFAQLSADEKNRISHRGKALELLRERLDKR
jgi:XTP/dITP diphosphohydrolase